MNMTSPEPRPFEGLRILDLTHVLAGPFCTYQLALLGAETIKIENPHDPDIVRGSGPDPAMNAAGMGTSFLTQNANKRCITANLRTERGREIVRKLAATADVFVENYRTGALDALGLGPAAMRALNPRLIYCSMTGFGQRGPKATHNAYDQVIQAASGLMSVTGERGAAPLKAGAPVFDYAAGLSAAFAVSAAIHLRERTGEGQHIDCAMFDSSIMLMSSLVTSYKRSGIAPKARGNDLDEAGVSAYNTRDGKTLLIGCFNARQNERFWRAIGEPHYGAWGKLAEQKAHRDELAVAFTRVIATRDAEDWERFFIEINVPASRVRDLGEALSIEQVAHRNLLHTFDEVPEVEGAVTVPVAAYSFEHGGPRVDSAPRPLGADTDAVLAELGYDDGAIRELRASGVI
jgi:crotonobetainyl-CoA:carnitine CoA-transferase CaiB-like acyl-CoA transferase